MFVKLRLQHCARYQHHLAISEYFMSYRDFSTPTSVRSSALMTSWLPFDLRALNPSAEPDIMLRPIRIAEPMPAMCFRWMHVHIYLYMIILISSN